MNSPLTTDRGIVNYAGATLICAIGAAYLFWRCYRTLRVDPLNNLTNDSDEVGP